MNVGITSKTDVFGAFVWIVGFVIWNLIKRANTLMQNLKVIIETKNSEIRILSPSVGFCSLKIRPGKYLAAGAFIGNLKILNSNFNLYLPADVFGTVSVDKKNDIMLQVEYKQELFRLSPENIGPNNEEKKTRAKTNDQNGPEKGFLVRASTTGIFYRRSSPDSPAYVEEGQKIEKGKILGLIEVMKTFNHIVFQGTDSSESGVIKNILREDAQEVKLGDGLFVVE